MAPSKRKSTAYTQPFKGATVTLVTEQGYTAIETAWAVGVRLN
ncbi:MAG: hypothetical protein ACI9XU_000328 [Arenicella sp.]|jgi:hypothetical protein